MKNWLTAGRLQYQVKINQLKKLNTNWDIMAGMTQKRALKALKSFESFVSPSIFKIWRKLSLKFSQVSVTCLIHVNPLVFTIQLVSGLNILRIHYKWY